MGADEAVAVVLLVVAGVLALYLWWSESGRR